MAVMLRQSSLKLKRLVCFSSMIPKQTHINDVHKTQSLFKMIATFSTKHEPLKNGLLRSNSISAFRHYMLNCNNAEKLMFKNCVRNLTTLTRHLNNKSVILSKNSCFEGKILRFMSRNDRGKQNTSTVMYICAAAIFMVGMSYAGVPLYRMFCQATGLGGQPIKGHDTSKVETMAPVREKTIKIRFNADTASSMQWNFKPQQPQITLVPGETALAFYTARNPTDRPVIGISTYNVLPFEAGVYFNKIQCFCFEEQRLNPHEQVDMPVFFYIDPEFAEDPKMEFVDTITLSYTFFEAKEGMTLPLPGFMRSTQNQ